MKKRWFRTLLCSTLLLSHSLAFSADQNQSSEDLTPQEISQLSEAFGHFIGKNLSSPGVQFNLDSVIQGMRDEAAGKPSPLDDQEYEQMMGRLQAQAFRNMASDNLQKANEFLSKNSKESGVVIVEPGKLQYTILTQGNGQEVQPGSKPQVNYVGKYIDGTVFGQSEEGEPITIPLDETISGFSKGIVGMKEGEKRRLFVHPDMGYGTTGPLPPNAMLILDVEVVKSDSSDDQESGQ